MGYLLSDEQIMIADMARTFSDEKLKPNAARLDEEKRLDRDTLGAMGALGFGAICVADDVGGAGLGRIEAALIFEQLSRGDVSMAAFASIHNMCATMIDRFGDADMRKRLLPKLASMEFLISYCLTEPDSGSDAAALRTSAHADGAGHYVLNGAKAFISGGGFSDFYLVMARTGGKGAGGVSAFVVEKDAPGLSFGKNERKMGWHAQPTAQVNFEECRVPVENRIGPEGEGFKYAMGGLDGGRLNIAACSLGGAQDAFDRALAYGMVRKQFGQRLTDFQATQFKLADMAIELEAGRTLLYEAARRLDAKDPQATKFCAMAKRFVTDMGSKVANDALQLHGGYGYLADYEVERIVRDLRVHQILEGTNEIMRVIVARDLLRQ